MFKNSYTFCFAIGQKDFSLTLHRKLPKKLFVCLSVQLSNSFSYSYVSINDDSAETSTHVRDWGKRLRQTFLPRVCRYSPSLQMSGLVTWHGENKTLGKEFELFSVSSHCVWKFRGQAFLIWMFLVLVTLPYSMNINKKKKNNSLLDKHAMAAVRH